MFFCLGNICRSPIAHGLFEHLIAAHPDRPEWQIASSGTSSYHVGESPDLGSQRVSLVHGIDISAQRSRHLSASDFTRFDYLVAMSHANLAAARDITPMHHDKLLLIRDFEPGSQPGSLDVPDPWGGGERAFEEVYEILARCMPPLIDFVHTQVTSHA